MIYLPGMCHTIALFDDYWCNASCLTWMVTFLLSPLEHVASNNKVLRLVNFCLIRESVFFFCTPKLSMFKSRRA